MHSRSGRAAWHRALVGHCRPPLPFVGWIGSSQPRPRQRRHLRHLHLPNGMRLAFRAASQSRWQSPTLLPPSAAAEALRGRPPAHLPRQMRSLHRARCDGIATIEPMSRSLHAERHQPPPSSKRAATCASTPVLILKSKWKRKGSKATKKQKYK